MTLDAMLGLVLGASPTVAGGSGVPRGSSSIGGVPGAAVALRSPPHTLSLLLRLACEPRTQWAMLAIEPGNLKALALSGSAAFERGELAQAISVRGKLVALAPPESDVAAATASGILLAKKLLDAERAADAARASRASP